MRSATLTILAGLWVVLSVTAAEARERVYYFHNDHLGTPQAMSDASGRKVWEAEYDPFGKAIVNQDPDGDGQIVINNLRFPGQYYDTETGLHYNYHRDYDPATGRYLQPDPIGLLGGLNPYRYALNDPINAVDPTGLWGEDVHSGRTYIWALKVGLTASQAERIARADQGTDGGFGSWMPIIGDQSRHFNQGGGSCDSRSEWAEREFQRAVAFFKAGKIDVALGHLGRGLHSIQDTYAHRNWDTGTSGAVAHPSWYDWWDDPRNSTARTLTGQKSLEYLRRFLTAAPNLR